MNEKPTLIINEVSRQTVEGNTEALMLTTGVNILVGEPNTGKTKWLETIDYLLGDTGVDPYSVGDDDLENKYQSAALSFTIGEQSYYLERRWREKGNKNKFFLDDNEFSAKEFQHFLMEKLQIPIISSPSGNPYSGRTWPELSFRVLLRHFYRQQRLWGSLVEKQPDDTFRASVLLFLGLAENLYTEDFQEIVRLRIEIQRLEARRDQFEDTLKEITRNFLEEEDLNLTVTEKTLASAQEALEVDYNDAVRERNDLINNGIETTLTSGSQSMVMELTQRRSKLLVDLQSAEESFAKAQERLTELQYYKKNIEEEASRLGRAKSATRILSGLRLTHCPSCNQTIKKSHQKEHHCALCHQENERSEIPDELNDRRISFEKVRLKAESDEAKTLVLTAESLYEECSEKVLRLKGKVSEIDRELKPAREKVSALIQENVSIIDVKIGSINERLKQIRRLAKIFARQKALDEEVDELNRKLEPIVDRNRDLASGLAYEERASILENGMNEYLTELNKLRPSTWKHSAVEIYLSQSTAAFRVGRRRWDVSLGGTTSLYYLMAYHYSLISMTNHPNTRFPGFLMVDYPAEFAGVKIGDADDFTIQPFIDLFAKPEYKNCQAIFTGATFEGLKNVNRIELKEPYIT